MSALRDAMLWVAAVIAAVLSAGGFLLVRRQGIEPNPAGRIPFHFVDHLDLLPELRSPLCGKRAEYKTPANVVDFSAASSVVPGEAGGVLLRHVARDEISARGCLEVKATPRGRARIQVGLASERGGYVQIEDACASTRHEGR
ncbi:MAG: hypothetical protein U1E76_01330 [Planctomycetota bacterium]